MQVLASQLPFLANRNAELAVPPLFWPVNCIKIRRNVALLSGPTVYSIYCVMSSLESRQCLHQSQVNVKTRVKSMSSLESRQCLHQSQVNVFTRVKSMSLLESS